MGDSRLVAEKKRVAPSDRTSPFYTIAVGHRLDSSLEEKREADVQRSLMKWSGIVLSWPPEISSFSNSSGNAAHRCLRAAWSSLRREGASDIDQTCKQHDFCDGVCIQVGLYVSLS